LVNLFQFKPDEVKQLAEKIGISEEILNVIRESGLSAEELRRRLGLNGELADRAQQSTPDSVSPSDVNSALDAILGSAHPEPTPMPESHEDSDRGASTGGGSGRGAPPSGGSPRTEYHTYIGVHQSEPRHETSDTHKRRLATEDIAIDLIRQQDGQHFKEIRRMPTNHEGYDLEAINEQGEVMRYIEVKAMTCAWTDRPATISEPQFEAARRKGEKFWLYVVEKVGQPDPKIHRIPNPQRSVRYFTFDYGWSSLGDQH
jgi:hypothetical protein